MKKSRFCFLVDDDIDDQEFFCLALRQLDETILCEVANSGEEAIERLEAGVQVVPDYLFIDINMPRMNGFVCLKELRKLDHLKETRMILYSASPEEKVAVQSKELGAFAYVVKPPYLGLLREKLSQIIFP